MSINQLILVSQETRDSSNSQIRTPLEEQRQTIIAEYRKKSQSSRTPSNSHRGRVPTSTRTVMATEIGIS